MLRSLLRFGKAIEHPPYDPAKNPFRARKQWPPDFSMLSQKEQFRLERRFRRRHKMKWLRPRWIQGVKITQWSIILFVVVYGVMFYKDPKSGEEPFAGVRDWFTKTGDQLFPKYTNRPAPAPVVSNDERKPDTKT